MARAPLFVVLLAGAATACSNAAGTEEEPPKEGACLLAKCDSEDFDENHFEYVIVGSGAGGGPLAANLARRGHEVLLLEAGDEVGPSLTYDIPAFHPQASEDPDLSWTYLVDHYADTDQAIRDTKMVYDGSEPQGIFYPRGGTVGGSTAVNAMITIYPHASDWNYLADLTGDESWRADAMRPYFERLEDNRYLGIFDDRDGHGFDGWLAVEQPDTGLALRDVKILETVKATALTAGEGLLGDIGAVLSLVGSDVNVWDPARDGATGVYTIPTATDDRRRNGTREYIQRTIEEGYPLTLRPNALVTNVVFADEPAEDGTPRAIGVDYLSGPHLYGADRQSVGDSGTPRRVTVTREVVLSAGAFNTPQLLKLSGIGPRDELESLGIDVRVDLPGVGENLQDRYEVGVITQADEGYALLEGCTFTPDDGDPCVRQWQDRDGPYTSNGGVVALIERSSTAAEDPDLIIFGLPGYFKGYYPGYSADVSAATTMFTWAILKGHTRNTGGSVRLRSTDPRDPPLIDFNYFSDPTDEDLEAMIDGVEKVREIIAETNDLNVLWSTEEVWPGPDVQTRSDIGQWVMDEAWGHHASCSAPIGRDGDPMAVLDSRFRVRGVTGLRVVDASVFPRIPGFFIVSSVYMISEKASDVMLEDIGEPRQQEFVSQEPLAIPDNSARGVTSTIEVPTGTAAAADLSVSVHIDHPYPRDLVVRLVPPDGEPIVLYDRELRWFARNLHRTYKLPRFDGAMPGGSWTLEVSDRARRDVGTLSGWSIQLSR